MVTDMKITIVDGDDWIGIYKDGNLVYEDHSITSCELLKIVDIAHEFKEADYEWIGNLGNFPKLLDQVKFGK